MKKIHFLFLVFLSFTACEKDEITSHNEKTKNKQVEHDLPVMKRITRKQITGNTKLTKHLKQLSLSDAQAGQLKSSMDKYGFEIFTNTANYYESGSYHSYTFVISTPGNKAVENLLLSLQKNGTYKAYIVTYDLNQKESLALARGEEVDLQGKISFTLLENFDPEDAFNKQLTNDYRGCCECKETYVSRATGWTIVNCRSGGGGGGGGAPDQGDPGMPDKDYGDNYPVDSDDYGNTESGGNASDGSGGEGGETTLPLTKSTAIALGYILSLDNESKVAWLETHDAATQDIFDFVKNNGYSDEAKDFARATLEAMVNDDFSGLFNLELFNRDPYDVWGTLSQEEKDLIISFPYKAYAIFKNRSIAENTTRSKFGFNGRNDKSDAFRHAYFNAINTSDVGSYFAEVFADAHESDVPLNLALEKSMDLFNNAVGHDADIDFPNYSKSELIDAIYGKLLNGELRYLSPLEPVIPPNFGISPLTQLIPTNQ